jgi:hypothetical protein
MKAVGGLTEGKSKKPPGKNKQALTISARFAFGGPTAD